MFHLTRTLNVIRNNNIRTFLRKYATEFNLEKTNKKITNDTRRPKLIYSSYLEAGKEHMTRKQKLLLDKQRLRDDIQLQSRLTSAIDEELKPTDNGHQNVDKTSLDTECAAAVMNETEHGFPKNWMQDYEFYEGGIDEDVNIDSKHGTADASIAPSTVPCSGCGAHLHCASTSLPGYIPTEIFKGRTKKELKTIICQRCHFLKNYNIALDVEVSAESYVETISKIKNEFALAVIIVDLLDFPCSIWPGMQKILGSKRPVFVVGNKVDLLPRDSNRYLEHVKKCLMQQMLNSGFDAMNIKYISLISAKTGYGIEELITQLHKIWKHNGDVYILGCTNVGKSTLFNILLNSDYCRPEATDLLRKATTCPWPGTTLEMLKFPILRPTDFRVYHRYRRLFSERGQRAAEEKLRRDQARQIGSKKQAATLIGTVGRTFDGREDSADVFAMSSGTQPIVALDERKIEYIKSKWCYDTPGVMHPDQITNLLTTEELLRLSPEQMIAPRVFRFKPGWSVFLAGLARLDFLNCDRQGDADKDWIKIFIFTSLKQPVTMTQTQHADEFYEDHLGSEILGLPSGSKERLARWPGLTCHPELLEVVGNEQEEEEEKVLSCDILLSSVGWIGISVPPGNLCTFSAWTPYGRGIYMRTPSLVPYAERLIGKKIKDSVAYNMAKPFVFRK